MGNKNMGIFHIFNPCYLFNGSLSSIAEKGNWKGAHHFKGSDEKIVWIVYLSRHSCVINMATERTIAAS
jgi:hypothetical protein